VFNPHISTPTLRLFTPKREQKKGSNAEKSMVEYSGAKRKAKAMKSFLVEHMPDYSKRITLGETHMEEARDYAEKYGLPVALWFTSKSQTPALVKFMSTEFRRRLLTLEIPTTPNNQGVLEEYGFSNSTAFPELLIIPANSGWSKGSVIRYEEDTFSPRQLKDFLSPHVLKEPDYYVVTKEPQVVHETDQGQSTLNQQSLEDNHAILDFQSTESFPFDAMCPSI
jgi:hypothetical protein